MSATRDSKFQKALDLYFSVIKASHNDYPSYSLYVDILRHDSCTDKHEYIVQVNDFKDYSSRYDISIDRFVSTMQDYFEKCAFNRVVSGETKRSSVLISNPRRINPDSSSFEINIKVNYIRGQREPYPSESESLDTFLKKMSN